jgi:hypothetical protein
MHGAWKFGGSSDHNGTGRTLDDVRLGRADVICSNCSSEGVQANHKPSSVPLGPRDPRGGDHLSTPTISRRLQRPNPKDSDEQPLDVARTSCLPMWSCSRWGLPRPADHPAAGELLPHHFNLTGKYRRYVSVALSLGSPPLGVTQHLALRSSDFPRAEVPHAATRFAWTPQLTQDPALVSRLHSSRAVRLHGSFIPARRFPSD